MKSGKARWALALGLMALMVLAVAAGAWRWLDSGLSKPAEGVREMVLEVKEGEKLAQVSQRLFEKGWLFHPRALPLLVKLRGMEGPIHHGRHRLTPGMTPRQVLENLQAPGEPTLVRVVIPEGFRLWQIAHRLAAAGVIADAGRFLELARNPKTLPDPALATLPAPNLEGYLFPDTYAFKPGMDEAEVIGLMAQQLFKRWEADPLLLPITDPQKRHRLITLASIVEREARVASERPVVAGLYANRLARGMLLQCDATVQYALPNHKTRLLYADLEINSPYNTYKFPGLPPGPIASPGLASLQAAAQPRQHNYLYMVVVDPNGRHAFSATQAEHSRAVGRFRQLQRQGLYR